MINLKLIKSLKIFIDWRQIKLESNLKHPEFTYSACGSFKSLEKQLI